MNTNYKKGILFAIIAAIISGISIFYNKQIIVSGLDPLLLNVLKNGGAAIILTLLLINSTAKYSIFKLNKNDLIKLILIAVIGGSIPFILYFEGLKYASAINANLIHKTLFIWVAVMAIPLLGEKLNLLQVFGYLFLFLGNILIAGKLNINIGYGEILIFSATILWALENIIVKFALKNIKPEIVAWSRMFMGTILLILFSLSQNKLHLIAAIDIKYIAPIAISSLFLAAYVSSYFKALRFAPATLVTSILILSTPVTNMLYSIFILHQFERPTVTNIIFTLAGIVLILPLLKKFSFKNES